MPPTNYRIGPAAVRLGVHENTVRLWCAEFASHLSATANPPSGQARALTEDDLRTLELVRDLRTAGYPIAYVRERLPSTTATIEPPQPPSAPQSQPDGPSALVPASAVVQALDARLAALQRLLDAPPAAQALQKAHESGFNRGVAVGVTVAVSVLLGVLLLLGLLASAGLGWVVRLLGG